MNKRCGAFVVIFIDCKGDTTHKSLDAILHTSGFIVAGHILHTLATIRATILARQKNHSENQQSRCQKAHPHVLPQSNPAFRLSARLRLLRCGRERVPYNLPFSTEINAQRSCPAYAQWPLQNCEKLESRLSSPKAKLAKLAMDS